MDSRRIDSESIVDMVFHLKWKSDEVMHTDAYQASRINVWRDYSPVEEIYQQGFELIKQKWNKV